MAFDRLRGSIKQCAWALAGFGGFVVQGWAADAGYPTKPVRVIVPFVAAGSTDILARALATRLAEQLGQAVVIDNRGGGGGVTGADLAAKSPPDGYTILITTAGVIVTTPSLHSKLPYDSNKDFAPVSIIASLPNMLVVHPSEVFRFASLRPIALAVCLTTGIMNLALLVLLKPLKK